MTNHICDEIVDTVVEAADNCSLESFADHYPTNSRGQFPEEVIVNILTYLDGSTLIRCRLVSNTWKDIVDRLTRCLKPVWKRICNEEIPWSDLNAICSSIDAKYWMIQTPWKWDKVYQCWKRWRTCTGWRGCKRRVRLPGKYRNSLLKSVKTSGKYLLITTDHGDLLAYDSAMSTVFVLFNGDIAEFHLLANQPRDLFSETDFILQGLAHDEILIVCFHQLFRLNLHTGKVRQTPKFIFLSHPFGHFLGEEVIVRKERDIFVMERKQKYDREAKASFIAPVDVISVGNKTVVALVKEDMNDFLVFSRLEGSDLKETKRLRIFSRMEETSRVIPVSETSFIVYRDNAFTFECIVDDISRNYDSRNLFESRITHVYHHCGIIFFGTDSGFIATLVVKDMNQLLELETQSYSKMTVTNECASVSSMVLDDDFENPILWVAVNKRLYMIRWC